MLIILTNRIVRRRIQAVQTLGTDILVYNRRRSKNSTGCQRLGSVCFYAQLSVNAGQRCT